MDPPAHELRIALNRLMKRYPDDEDLRVADRAADRLRVIAVSARKRAASIGRPHLVGKRSQEARILSILRARGPRGATGDDLVVVALGYTGRVNDLRRAGYDVRTENGRYVLYDASAPTAAAG